MDTFATVIVILTVIPFVDGQCTFPDSFNGTWITSYDGTWTTNSTHLLNYKAISPSGVFLNAPNPTLDFTCFIKDGTKYVLRSADQVELFTGFFVYMHTCIDLQEVTSTKYVYYYGTVAESTGLRFTALNTVADVCTQTNHDLAYNQHLALRNGSETSGLTLCPPSIYGSYFYNTCNDSNSNTTSMDVCDSRQQLIYNYTLCNTIQMFTSEGVLDCLFYADIDTVSYVTLYNRDSTTPDGSTTYQFVCLAIELSGSTVYITANPETCTENQSPTNISSPGQIIQFTPFYLCPFTSEDSSFDFLPFILGGVGLLLLLLLIIIIVCCCKRCKRRKRRRRKKRKKKKKRDEEEGTSDDDDTDEDASSRSSDSRSTSESSVKSSQQYIAQEVEHEEKKSVDSGISEPTVTHRTISKGDDGEEDGQTEKELVINDDGELELDDKTSRPQSGQRSRMSDLPPSTLPEDEQPGTSRSDPEEQRVEEDEHGEQINKEKHGSEVDTCEQEIENEDPEIYGENEEDNVKEEEREPVRKDTPVEEHTQEQLKEQLQETIEEQDENQDQEDKQSITSHDKIDANANNEEKSDEEEEREGSKLNEYKTVQHEQNDVDVDTDGGEEEEDDEEGEEEEDEEEREEEDEAQEEDEEEDEEEEEEELQTQQQQQQSGEEDEEEDEEDEEEEEEEYSAINLGHENDAVLDKKENGRSQMSVKGESNEDNAGVIVGMADENRHIKDDHERKQEKVLIKADADQQKHSDSEVNVRNEDENNADKGDYENSLEGDKAKSVNGQEQQEGLGFVEANRHDNKSVKSDHEDNQYDTNVKINDNQTERTNNYEEKTEESDQEESEGEHQGEPQSESKDEHTEATEADQNEEPQIHDNTGEEIFSKDNTSERSILVVQQPIQADGEQNKVHDRKEEHRETDEKEEEERESEPEVKDKERDVVDKHSERDGEKVKKTSKKYQRQPSLEEETTREYSKIGGKKEKDVQHVRPLTTVLISRKEEEKKRMKNREKSKNHKMRRLARNKTHKFGPQIGKDDDIVADEDELMFSSDDEMKPGGGRSAPFIAQYNNKKRIEHILDQQHYWSDPDAEKESFGLNESMTHVFGDIVSESGSDYEELVGPDGVVYRVKRSNHTDDRDGIDSEPVGTKRAKSFDSLASVEDPESPEGHVSKKRLSVPDTRKGENEQSENLETGQAKEDSSEAANKGKSKTRMIYVKENVTDDKKTTAKPKSRDVDKDGVESDVPSDFCDTDMDKLSERDSGLDDELEDAVDVVLNKDQQAMIVSMLFDEEMNLRPQFARDDDGRIIRRLDNTVIYDPHTGRFTFHKQLGKIFNLPRLRRNSKGRPIGGYVEDSFGPHESDVQKRTPSSKLQYRTASGKSIRSHVSSETGSPSPDMKRSRGEGKYVGFVMPDDDADTLTSDQLDVHIRGRRDIGSAIRRKLNKRLFRKKRKMPATTSALPNVSPRRAWTQDGTPNGQDMTMGPRGLSTLSIPYSRSGTAYGTPGSQRRPLGNTNLEQQQMFKQGLERDRKILEERQDMLNKKPIEASGQDDDDNSVDLEDENRENDVNRPVFDTSQSFYTDDGRLVVRERGCPDLKRPSTLFTIVRRQEDLEGETPRDLNEDNNYSNTNRNCKSAPSFAKPAERQPYNKENTFHVMRHDGSESQLSGIDNNRLRRLLEELYRDKKYFDEYIQSKEPESEEFVHSKGLAEHGRGYLMERAEYWERRGPLPPKPPMTEIGWKMYRQQTMMESRLNSDRGSLTLTGTSDEQQHNSLPGVVDSQENGHNNGGNNESYA